MKEEKSLCLWCGKCGQALQSRNLRIVGYRWKSGLPIWESEMVCPEKRWYNWHTRLIYRLLPDDSRGWMEKRYAISLECDR